AHAVEWVNANIAAVTLIDNGAVRPGQRHIGIKSVHAARRVIVNTDHDRLIAVEGADRAFVEARPGGDPFDKEGRIRRPRSRPDEGPVRPSCAAFLDVEVNGFL